MRIGKLAFLDKIIGEKNDIRRAHARMEGNQALPDGECCGELIGGGKLPNDVEISGAIGSNHLVEDGFNVGINTPAARERLGAALGASVNGAANFRKGLLDFVPTQQKISIAPGECG